ncbi:hypothetical protein PVAND_011643 [Polypedilum vanderplanki]|uniref:Uncharacterized protein n=1 Tax=Polypedilum vanderplanki TaxID=319348 RepID=A0A9J6CK34_POLVA|nr:hypothetical protein PVAND_011643 [Polypedilum vanderplanki]
MNNDQNDTCFTGSSLSGIYKNIFKSQTPVCMFYFSHPFGISTPSSANNRCEKESESKKAKKKSRYKTTTYLVTEIQKNNSDGSQDECDDKKTTSTIDRELLPWPKSFLLPPFVQMIEKKHGKKLPDFDAILKQVRKQAWNTPKSHHSFWSRGSSISSDDFSSLASPDSLNDKPSSTSFTSNKAKLRRKLKNSQILLQQQQRIMESNNGVVDGKENAGNGHGKAQTFLKRRYSVPEIIMRKYSLAHQKSCEESTSVYSSDTITKRNGQSTTAINNKPIQSQTPPSRTASPIKYFIPLSPQSNNVSSSSSNGHPTFGSGCLSFHSSSEISMRKQTLLRRMWSREFQHSKYSGSLSPPLRKATHHSTQSRLKKFNTLPEFISTSCEKCKELGVISRDNFDEDLCENKEDKSQQTDFDNRTTTTVTNEEKEEEEEREKSKESDSHQLSSASSNASTIIQSTVNNNASQTSEIKNSSVVTDSNGNNIIICMTALQNQQSNESNTVGDSEEMLQIEIDSNNNNATNIETINTTTTIKSSIDIGRNGDKYLKKQFSTQLEDEGYHPSEEIPSVTYHRLREERLNETEIDQYISQMLIDNLNNVIKTVNENLQANGERNLVKIDYAPPSSEVVESVLYNANDNKLRNQHEIAIQMRNAKNGDNGKNRNSNESVSLADYIAVERDTYENSDVNSQRFNQRHYFSTYVDSKSVSEHSTSTELSSDHQITAIINTGTSYPHNLNRPESILVPRVIGPKTESMEVNPSSSSAQEDDEFDGVPDSDDEDLSDVDSLDDVVTIKAKKLSELAHQQHKKAQALFRQTHLKGQAFFVPIVDTEQPIDEHIVVADTMPEKLKERLVLRQRRRDLKKQSEMKMKQWRMQAFIERKMEQMNVVNDYLADLSNSGGAFKIIGMSSKQIPIETNAYKKSNIGGSGWVPKQRVQAQAPSGESTSEKSSSKSKKLRNDIGMLESYKIDARGNMQIQAPKSEKEKPNRPKNKRTSYTSTNDSKRSSSSKTKLKTPSEIISRKSNPSSKRVMSNIPTSSASSVEAIDARRRQIMKDVQQMSVYKNDLTPDPDSGPKRKMWKTEIQEGDKHIEILEIVECVDGHMLAQQAPETNNNNNNSLNHLFTSSPSINTQNHHKNNHIPSSSHHPMYINKTFSVKTSGFDDTGRHMYASKIPVPVYHRQQLRHRQHPFMHYELRDTSPTSNNQSSSTDAEESLTSAGSSINNPPSSKVDRMIANLLMEALKNPEDLGIEFMNSSPNVRHVKRRSQSPGPGADSSSTGYYTGDSSRRSASNSAGKYHHRFEVIPEEKSSFSVDSSNDDFIEDEEEENLKTEKLNTINNDWKSKKNLQNNDIKTRNSTPQKQESNENIVVEKEEEKENVEGKEEEKSKTIRLSPNKRSPNKIITNSSVNNNLKTSPPKISNKSPKSSPAKSPMRSVKSIKSTSGTENSSANPSPEKKRQHNLSANVSESGRNKDSTVTKSFMMFTNSNENENENGNAMTYEKNLTEEETPSTAQKSEEHNHFAGNNLIHQFMSHKNSSSSSPSFSNIKANCNNHYHYHLYQYQTNHCCFNLLDHSKSSSTVTTAASPHDNYHLNCCSHALSNESSCPLGVIDITSNSSPLQKNKENEHLKIAETGIGSSGSVKFDLNKPTLNSGGSEFPSTVFNKLNDCQSITATPSSYTATTRGNTADEKIIEIELTNEILKKPQEDNDDCSCTKKYLPYKINEKNVWQMYETSDCKYIQSKHEIDEIFQPPLSGDSTVASENCNLLHSRSNFSNQIICHGINHETNHNENTPRSSHSVNINSQASPKTFNSTGESFYMPTFNIKPMNVNNECRCGEDNQNVDNNNENENEESITKTVVNDGDNESVIISNQSPSLSTCDLFSNNKQMGKLLNRPKAINNISREQVKPVEKEIQKEITKNGNTNSFKTLPKPIRLPSPVPKQQQQSKRNSYDENSNSSNESSSSSSSAESKYEIPKHSKVSDSEKQKNVKEKAKLNQENSLIKQENNTTIIPNIHQGWSVTVAGTHPDLAPDVEMKICFPKSKTMSQSASVGPSVTSCEIQKPESEMFYYKNNELIPASVANQNSNPIQYESKPPYYNHRRSLSLARIDSGLSGMAKTKSYNLPNLHMPRSTARNFKQVECTTISASKTIIPSRRSLSLDVGNRRLSCDSRSQPSPFTPSEMLSVVGSEIKKTLKPKVKTMSERDLTKRHLNCFTRSNGHIF